MAAGATYEPIATSTLGSAQASISFTDISGNYTDLIIAGSLRCNDVSSGATNALIRFNDDSGANYNYMVILGDSVSGSSSRGINSTSLLVSSVGNDTPLRYSVEKWEIFNYSNTNTFKSVLLNHMVNFGNQVQVFSGLWRSTSAITKISITLDGSTNLASGSSLTLYGVTAA